MGFQPDNARPGLFFPSGRAEVATDLFDTSGMTEDPAGSDLFAFDIGDYAYPVLTPVPHVEMTLFNLDDATVTITLYRSVGRRTTPVRGMNQVYAVGGVNVVDWQAPFGVPLTYWAAQFDADGNFIANTAQSVTQLDVFQTWLSDPLDPAGAVVVELAAGAANKLTRPQDADIVWADGSALGFATTSQRRGLVDAPIAFYTLTDDDSDKVNQILGDPYVTPSGPAIICLRVAAQMNTRLPKPFVALVKLDEYPVSHPAGGQATKWDGTATEVEEPAIDLVTSPLSYDDLDAAFTSYDDLDAAYGSYLERDRDYSLAGYADNH